jgi:putative membrane protein
MRHPLVMLLLRWAINAIGVVVAASVIPGIEYGDRETLFIVVVLGLFNAFLKPLLVFFALPFVVLTLGVGILFINALLLKLADVLIGPFQVHGFLAAFFGALVISLVNLALGGMIGDPPMPRRGRRPPPRGRPPGPGDRGDVIDI